MLDAIARNLSRKYRIHTVQTINDALKAAFEERPHVALVDYQLEIPDESRLNLRKIRWPFDALKHWVLEGRTPKQALDFMRIVRDADGVEQSTGKDTSRGFSPGLRKQLHEFSKDAELPEVLDGLDLSRNFLRNHPYMHVVLNTTDDVLNMHAWQNLQAAYPGRLHFFDITKAVFPAHAIELNRFISELPQPATRSPKA